MRLFDRLRSAAASLRKELAVYQAVFRHPRTPKPAKWPIGMAIAYVISPIDLIPDFIPVVGYLDDILIVPALILLARQMVPQDVIDDCRRQAHEIS